MILLTSLALEFRSGPATTRQCLTAGLAGFASVWFSQTAVLVLAGLGAALALCTLLEGAQRSRRPLWITVPIWAIASLAVAAAIEWLRSQAARLRPALGAVVVAALLAPPLYAVAEARPPYFFENFKPVLAHVRAHLRPGDAVYVFANAYQAVERYGAEFGLPQGSWTPGACDEKNLRAFIADVDRFRGAPRLWVIASSVPEFHHARAEIGRYLETIGILRDSVREASAITVIDPVSAELYDLSEPTRLQSATAATFSIRDFPTPMRPLCLDWIRPTPSGSGPGAR